jgi:uncharacterized protein YecE (DUF72 family)
MLDQPGDLRQPDGLRTGAPSDTFRTPAGSGLVRIAVGMSGYAYKEWKGSFYPADLPATGMLAHYATRFPTVEINNTFYRLPSERVLLDWKRQVPNGFRFTLKASRRITHQHRLKDVDSIVDYFLRNASLLAETRGPTLFQLPPFLHKDIPRLEGFLRLLPRDWTTAIEWRHPSWFDGEVEAVLRNHGVASVIADHEDGTSPFVSTAGWGYLRLHRAGYTDADLGRWAERIREQPWEECFVFFKHEEDIAGPAVAERFAKLVAR